MEDKYKFLLAKDIDVLFSHVELLYNELKRIKRRVYYRHYYRKRRQNIENIKKKIINEPSEEDKPTDKTQKEKKEYTLYFD